MTKAEALDYAIDFLRAFQPTWVVPKKGKPHWALPGHSNPEARERWEKAMERLQEMRKGCADG